MKDKDYHQFILRYFKSIFPINYYEHLQIFTIVMTLIVSPTLYHDTIDVIDVLISEFCRLFPSLHFVCNSY